MFKPQFVLRIIKKGTQRLVMKPAEFALTIRGRYQRKAFNRLKANFQAKYSRLQDYPLPKPLSEGWGDNIKRLERVFVPYPPYAFLRQPIIIGTMFVNEGGRWMQQQLSYLETCFSQLELKNLLREDDVGRPRLLDWKYRTSHNSTHHLYHLARYLRSNKQSWNDISTIIEWGGGYGNLAKIIRRLQQKNNTYIIIDIPLFSVLQWLYLSSVLGESEVVLLDRPDSKIQTGKINLLPICFLTGLNIQADLFISTWALCESPAFYRNYVAERNYFNAKHLLLASSGKPKEMWDKAREMGAAVENIPFLTSSNYAFK